MDSSVHLLMRRNRGAEASFARSITVELDTEMAIPPGNSKATEEKQVASSSLMVLVRGTRREHGVIAKIRQTAPPRSHITRVAAGVGGGRSTL